MSEWIPDDEWAIIVRHVPIVSVDLLVRYDGGILFGKRTNEPAKGEWFIPGGRVQKGETRHNAVHRVASGELDISVDIVESLGAFEHIYDCSDVAEVEKKHYLANGYVVDVANGEPKTDDQHEALRVFQSPPKSLNPHIGLYLDASETIDWS